MFSVPVQNQKRLFIYYHHKETRQISSFKKLEPASLCFKQQTHHKHLQLPIFGLTGQLLIVYVIFLNFFSKSSRNYKQTFVNPKCRFVCG